MITGYTAEGIGELSPPCRDPHACTCAICGEEFFTSEPDKKICDDCELYHEVLLDLEGDLIDMFNLIGHIKIAKDFEKFIKSELSHYQKKKKGTANPGVKHLRRINTKGDYTMLIILKQQELRRKLLKIQQTIRNLTELEIEIPQELFAMRADLLSFMSDDEARELLGRRWRL